LQPFCLAIDVGTSSLKAVVYAEDAEILASVSLSYQYQSPHPGWAETSTTVWLDALDGCLQSLNHPHDLLKKVQVIAFTGQMHTAVLLDENHQPIEPSILWLDRRAAAETAELQLVFDLPPYILNSTYTLPKLLWQARHQPYIPDRARHLLWPKDYLRFILTGELFTDVTESGGAGLLNWDTLDWKPEHLQYTGFDPQILPPILKPTAQAGRLLPELAKKYNLNPLSKVITGSGDVLALISAAPLRKGRLSVSIGSSSMIYTPLPAGQILKDPQNRIYTYPLLPVPMLGGVSSTSGAALQWALNNFYPDTPIEEAVQSALRIPPGSQGVFFTPFLAGERSPFWNDELRAGFHGLELSHSPAHLIRAVMEGVALSLRHLIEIFAELDHPIDEIALSGGATRTPGWPQILADVCQLPVSVYSGQETVTRALYAYACLSEGRADTFEQAILATFEEPQTLQPDRDLEATYTAIYRHYRQQVALDLQATQTK
jgi:xylulokinase